MKAIQLNEYGDSSVLQLKEGLDVPVIQPDQVLVKMAYAGINFIDTYQRTGLYQLPSFPSGLGREGAGTIVNVGGDVKSNLSEGDVVAFVGAQGAYAEYVAISAAKVVRVPDGISIEQAAAVGLQGLTAHYLCHSTHPVQKDERVLIHAAAGGTGRLLVQMAKMRGAEYVVICIDICCSSDPNR